MEFAAIYIVKKPNRICRTRNCQKIHIARFKNDLEVENALATVDSYSRHRSVRPVKHNPYMLYNVRELVEVDLTDR